MSEEYEYITTREIAGAIMSYGPNAEMPLIPSAPPCLVDGPPVRDFLPVEFAAHLAAERLVDEHESVLRMVRSALLPLLGSSGPVVKDITQYLGCVEHRRRERGR